jgi:hypothetical protein
MGHRTANWLVVIALLLAAISPVHAGAAPPAPSGVITLAGVQRSGRIAVIGAFKAQSGDTYPSTALFPSVGILYLQRTGGEVEQCTGVVVGDRQILTAAHCVCGNAETNRIGHKDFAACQTGLAAVSGRFFSPISGFSTLSGLPRVHPNYRYPDPQSPTITNTAVFDAAIVQTETSIGAPAAPISREPPGPVRYAFAAIGPYAEFSGGQTARAEDNDYSLISKATLLQPARFGAACGYKPALDTLCVPYEAIDTALASLRGVSACPADSGGGLFRFENGEPGPLVGLASYVWPAHGPAGCGANVAQRTYFLDLSKGGLRDWIVGVVGEPQTGAGLTCDDGRIYSFDKPYQFAIPGLHSLSLISLDDTPNFQFAKSDPAKAGNIQCEGTASISHCKITPGPAPQIYVYNRGVQFTLCWQ